jgi:hypothetical protein
MKDVSLEPGIQSQFIDWIAAKVVNFSGADRDCVLSLDEVQIRKCLEFDKGLNCFLGHITSVPSSNI